MERRYGTIRDKRLNQSLLNNSFKIDERSFWDIVGYIASFLEKVNYYNHDNEIEGHWKDMVDSDPVIYMVQIINQPIKNLAEASEKYDNNKIGYEDRIEIINKLLRWYDKINQWHDTLKSLDEVKLAEKIKNVLVDVLSFQRNELIKYKKSLDAVTEANLPVDKSHVAPTVLNAPPKPEQEFVGKPKLNVGPLNLDKIIHTFQKIIIHIQEFTKTYLEKRVLAKNTHRPDNAMYIAFALLFSNVQEQLNRFSKRHLDFYYRQILQQKNNSGVATKAIVNFELLPQVPYALVEEGAQLSAGKLFGSKQDILFETIKPTEVHSLALMEAQTLFLNTCKDIKIGTDQPVVSSISKRHLISKGKTEDPHDEWYAFGANKRSVQNTYIDASKVADIGFIISSPVLKLSEGDREIDLQFNMQNQTGENTFWTLLKQIQRNERQSLDTVFYTVFKDSLRISYTTAKGWLYFENYIVKYDEKANNFTIRLSLKCIDAAVEVGKKQEEALSWPAIKVELNEYSPVFLYSFWQGLELDTIDINVRVQHIRNLSLYNNIGKMPLAKTFDLFGPMPDAGSYLMIGKSELFQKQIDALNINIDWENLPDDDIETYYTGYPEDINNDSFKVQMTALSNNFWLPFKLSDAPVYQLFGTHNVLSPEGYQAVKLNKSSSFSFNDFGQMGVALDYSLKDPLKYEVQTPSGFVKLSLTEPPYGFGVELYQKEYIDIATYNAKHKTNLPFPNKPLVPKVKGVSVDYEASDVLFFDEQLAASSVTKDNRGEFYHITPFGLEDVITNRNVKLKTIIPNFDQEGYLFLGIKGVENSISISIYFHFIQSSTGIIINKEKLSWAYFQANKWMPFREGDIIIDNTNGFSKSGIIELKLPEVKGIGDANHQNLYWIRISTPHHAQHYPMIKGIYFNAVETICLEEDANIKGMKVPANSIHKLAQKHTGVKAVFQSDVSYGGSKVKSEDEFYASVSERLRHKSRAVSLWDYEQLILENFDDVRVVKCTNFNDAFIAEPCKVKLVVLSSKWTGKTRHYFDDSVLYRMKDFLMKLSSPFTDIQVINPTVEYLKVNCIAEFKPENSGGYYINLLDQDISNFLSPVSDIDTGIGGIGGKMVPTMLVSFLENLNYIKSIDKLSIEHIIIDEEGQFSLGVFSNDELIQTAKPWSILSPVIKHNIITKSDEQDLSSEISVGLGNMIIGMDLIIDQKEDLSESDLNIEETTEPQEKASENDAILVFKDKQTYDGRQKEREALK